MKYKIIIDLLNGRKHLREIAKNIDESPATVMRKLNLLKKENIIDYEEKGRNKEYFLKDTLEARNASIIAEYCKLNSRIIKYPIIRKIVKEIIQKTKGEMVILFGSYAKGTAQTESDIDIYIETASRQLKAEIAAISEKISIHIGEFDKSSLLSKEIIKNHIIIQNAERFFRLI